MIPKSVLEQLRSQFKGDLYDDNLSKIIYATDASVYRKIPLAVAYPKDEADIKHLIAFALEHKTSLIPRTAGTSLAGQCVGEGIVVDVSKYFTRILDINETAKTVTVQPGVVRDELNNYLKPFGLFFGPNTSTSNRCMIGGMVGNNSSGTTSIKYGTTRDKLIALKTILSDGSAATFHKLSSAAFEEKCNTDTLEGHIYKDVYETLQSKSTQQEIKAQFPKPEIHRRNTGYAIDTLITSNVFSDVEQEFNMCKLLAGSEGTLALTTAITLQLDPLPPKHNAIIALHFKTIEDCLKAVTLVMQHDLYACEMLDDTILNLTKHNKTQQSNRQFIVGDPKAILMCELKADENELLHTEVANVIATVEHSKLCYANPVLKGEEITKAMALRKAGLGLLGNMIGDKKAVACIEDTAVALEDLSSYIDAFSELMASYDQKAVYYAHAGAGELHLRPILNLKASEDVILFKKITADVAKLVKSYNGSMSGEHGDGIVRSEFIPLMIGDANYEIIKRIKTIFDPHQVFNPGKIVNALPMDKNLRYEPDRKEPKFKTFLDFSASEGILREAEKCNGSGDCRKLPEFGGTMCPSYRATRNEKDTTRARANALREFLTHSEKSNRFDHEELKAVFDLCLSCKACASECPSSVDVASLKAEFQYQYQTANGYKFKDAFFANATRYNKLASKSPKLVNVMFQNSVTSGLIKRVLGMHAKRTLPQVQKAYKISPNSVQHPKKTVYLFVDEYLKYLESDIIKDLTVLLTALNYNYKLLSHEESGRSFISKGFLKEAKRVADANINVFKSVISEDTPLIGIEPSAILAFRDEYPKLADDVNAAKSIAKHTYLIEEFLQQEIKIGNISADQFTDEEKEIKFHGHCYQKALSNQHSSYEVLSLPKNYKVTIIPSGCCGMAGSFGYEKAHYEVSMQIGEQTLFPAVRNASDTIIISANGTSCRHQILDGTQRKALHPVTVMKNALIV